MQEAILFDELKLSEKLAIDRTVMAADRSMLAGVRTSVSFIGFGFTIFNVLRVLQVDASVKVMRPETPRNIGLFMLLSGTLPLVVEMIQYYRILTKLGRKNSIAFNPYFQMACVILFLGIILIFALIANVLLL
jgi:putative membrane protein